MNKTKVITLNRSGTPGILATVVFKYNFLYFDHSNPTKIKKFKYIMVNAIL